MKRGIGWPIGVTVALALTVAGYVHVIRLANADPSFAVEPDYYKKAVAFDSTAAAQRRSAALGWTAAVTIAAASGHPAAASLSVTLRDTTQQPVGGATVRAAALFVGRANDIQALTLSETAPGVYAAPLRLAHAGQWEIRLEASRGSARFLQTARAEVVAR